MPPKPNPQGPPPLFPLLLAVYPTLALYQTNMREIPPHTLWRPLFLSLACGSLAMAFIYVRTRDWGKSALLSSLFILLFSSYGQVHAALQAFQVYEEFGARYLALGLFMLALFLAGFFFLRKRTLTSGLSLAFNVAAVVLILLPLNKIIRYQFRPAFEPVFPSEWVPQVQMTAVRPDVYYFILDGYARMDYMQSRIGFDNARFIDALTQRGFYVAPCSRTNYNNTILALTSTLNMRFFPELEALAKSQGLTRSQIWRYLKPNLTMQAFRSLGYQSVAFDSGYYWSSMDQADIYLQPWEDIGDPPYMTDFEYTLLKGTPLIAWYDRPGTPEPTWLDDLSFPYWYHVAQQEYILEQAPHIAEIEAPTFTFIHVMIPHEPMVFSPERINTSTPYFNGGSNWPATPAVFQQAYINGVEYLNPRMLEVVDRILKESDAPPIIIIQGDHGFWSGINLPILNAYYLPGDGQKLLYPDITPVNTFRLIFDHYFGADMGLVADASYLVADIYQAVEEQMPDCRSKSPKR